jgi:formate/nitrite transporter
MYMSASWARRGAPLSRCIKVLAVSYIGNFIGSVFLAWLIFRSGVMLDRAPDGSLPLASYAAALADGKTALPFGTAFIRGVICNWLVCLAIFMSLTSSGGASKAALMWPPITAFVAMGMEHSVANMFFVPLGILIGGSREAAEAGIALASTWRAFLVDNLVPVTLGNIVGGAVFTAFPYLCAAGPGKGPDER